MSRQDRTPKLCHHKGRGLAYVTLNGREHYLGKWKSAKAKKSYDRLVSQWLANGRTIASIGIAGGGSDFTIIELCAAFWEHAEKRYRHANGEPTGEAECFKYAMRPLKNLYGDTPAAEFGPLKLKAVRLKMIEAKWTRKNINRQVGRIRQIFRWGVSNELLNPSVMAALKAVEPLNRTEAKSAAPITPADAADIEVVKPFVSRQVWAMIQVELLTGMRPNEVCRMRVCDVDRSDENNVDPLRRVWRYTPPVHKTAHHGITRTIIIGPKAQEIIRPFLKMTMHAAVFSPREAVSERNTARQQPGRKLSPSAKRRRRKQTPESNAGDFYTVASYRRAITYGSDRAETAERKAMKERGEKLPAERIYKRWSPNQLRHSAATFLREKFGIEAARMVLGHKSAAVTEVYAERDVKGAEKIMAQVG